MSEIDQEMTKRIHHSCKDFGTHVNVQLLAFLNIIKSWIFILQELQECFEKKDTELLQKVLMAMPKEEAENHLKRCIDSGLWVPNAKEAAEQEAAADATSGEGET